jgi:hypothetical protein
VGEDGGVGEITTLNGSGVKEKGLAVTPQPPNWGRQFN